MSANDESPLPAPRLTIFQRALALLFGLLMGVACALLVDELLNETKLSGTVKLVASIGSALVVTLLGCMLAAWRYRRENLHNAVVSDTTENLRRDLNQQ